MVRAIRLCCGATDILHVYGLYVKCRLDGVSGPILLLVMLDVGCAGGAVLSTFDRVVRMCGPVVAIACMDTWKEPNCLTPFACPPL